MELISPIAAVVNGAPKFVGLGILYNGSKSLVFLCSSESKIVLSLSLGCSRKDFGISANLRYYY